MKNRINRLIVVALFGALLLNISSCNKKQEQEKNKSLTGTITNISKYGNIEIDIPIEKMEENGFEYGDVLNVTFNNQSLDLPYCSNYSDVEAYKTGVFGKSDDVNISLAINIGDFATTYEIATKNVNDDGTYEWVYRDGYSADTTFVIMLKTKGGYYDEYVLHNLKYTNERDDYPNLTDEQYANFRMVNTTGIKEDVLYRSTTPVDPAINRNEYVSEAISRNGINVIINMTDDETTLKSFDGFSTSYYSKQKYIALNMTLDFLSDDFKIKLKDAFIFMAENEGKYLIHCKEGKDRTGFMVAIIEFLMGASFEEARDDYMVSYYNFYGIDKNDEKYDIVATSNFEKIMNKALGVEDIKNEDLSKLANNYLLSIGLSANQIEAIKNNLK